MDYLRLERDAIGGGVIWSYSGSLVSINCRYLRKLDQELHKFQLELEADNRGITEVLETDFKQFQI